MILMDVESDALLSLDDSLMRNCNFDFVVKSTNTFDESSIDFKPECDLLTGSDCFDKIINDINVDDGECFNLKDSCREKSFFGLPWKVKDLLKAHKGIEELYKWQEDVLSLDELDKRKNLLLTLPTSGGKTLIAEFLILKELLCNFHDVLFILPFVSLVHEKVNSLSPFALDLGFLIEEYAGSKGKFPPTKRMRKHSVFIATIEKADIFVNSLIENERIREIGLLVVDEFHLIGEPIRGAILESVLVKMFHCNPNCQVIGLSATIGNPSQLTTFLDGFMYTNNFRPVSLYEFVKIDDEVYRVTDEKTEENKLAFVKRFKNKVSYSHLDIDPDFVCFLVKEVIPRKSCLVFCPTKKNCENMAELICKTLPKKHTDYKRDEKETLMKTLLSEGRGRLCGVLKRTIVYGIAYHHSGLTTAERKILEEAFQNNILCCLCCTSTLAAGVNLPAARVILRSPFVGCNFISLSQYKQMIGRAGRAGLEEKGESYLLCRNSDAMNVNRLLLSDVADCCSQLSNELLTKLILCCVSLKIVQTRDELICFLGRTLMALQHKEEGVLLETTIDYSLCELKVSEILVDSGEKLSLTKIGMASVKSNLSIDTAKQLYMDLMNAKNHLVLSTQLHLLYLIAPYDIEITPNHEVLTNVLLALQPPELRVANIVGIGEASITRLISGRKLPAQRIILLRRFFAALILNDLIDGKKSVWDISKKYHLDRGFINNFLSNASAFSSAVLRFCEVFPEELWCYTKLLIEFPQKILFCCSQELIPLMELPAVRLGRARQLYNAGFKDISSIASASAKQLVSSIDLLPMRQAKLIISSAKIMLLSKIEDLNDEAQKLSTGLTLAD